MKCGTIGKVKEKEIEGEIEGERDQSEMECVENMVKNYKPRLRCE